MRGRETVFVAVLLEHIAHGKLPAKSIAPPSESGENSEIVRAGVDENRNVQTGETHGVGDSLFISEIRQRYEDSGNALAVQAKQVSTFNGIVPRLDRTHFCDIRIQDNCLDVKFCEGFEHSLTPFTDDTIVEKATVSDDDCDCLFFHGESFTIF